MFFNYFMLTVELRRGGFALGLPRYHKRKDIVNMYQKTAIDMRLAKISAKIYELEDRCFKMTEETNKLLNEVSELVAVRYREAKASEKKSHNLYCEYKDLEDNPVFNYQTALDKQVDLTQAVTKLLKKGRPVKGSIS